ncbi:hypothetical protein GN956_G10307 [Arapaima gigas]
MFYTAGDRELRKAGTGACRFKRRGRGLDLDSDWPVDCHQTSISQSERGGRSPRVSGSASAPVTTRTGAKLGERKEGENFIWRRLNTDSLKEERDTNPQGGVWSITAVSRLANLQPEPPPSHPACPPDERHLVDKVGS